MNVLSKEQIMRLNAPLFAAKSREILLEMAAVLPALADDPTDLRHIRQVYRAMSAFRGAGAMFGFDDVASLAQAVMNALELPRNGDAPVSPTLLSLSQEAVQQIDTMVEIAVRESTDQTNGNHGLESPTNGDLPIHFDRERMEHLILTLNTL
ncbi:MAG: hypothetical protein G8345_04890 [Magnetococcales bacterium]|nr:Hpt domain-containing protein [Magnetococcales bacterium]NGZ26207.1 hypothetical protein [Magnetococcales bacterium]